MPLISCFKKNSWLIRPVNRSVILDIFKFGLVMFVLIWFSILGNEKLGYNWQWFQIPPFLLNFEDGKLISGPLLRGLFVTIKITGISFIFSVIFGLTAALLRLSKSFSGKILAVLYLETVRNTPLLIQLFFIYFVISPVLDISGYSSAVITLSLFEGAYISEIIRSGILSLEKGQWEAAYSLGISAFHTYSRIIFPQAISKILPPLTSQVISLIKDSALVSTIAIYDLTMEGRIIISDTYLTFETWFTIAAIYLIFTMSISLLVKRMGKKLKIEY